MPGGGTPKVSGEQAVVKPTRKRPPRDLSSSVTTARRARSDLLPLQGSSATLEVASSSPQLASSAPLLASLTSPTPSASSPIASFTTMSGAQEVLDEMPQSVDNESFLNFMNEQTFGNAVDANIFEANTVDDEIGSDVDSELPKKKGSRGVNFTIPEDKTLVRAWQAISLDPITGDEQPGATYWKRIWEHFQQHNSNCLEQVDRLNPSGTNARDKVNIAQQLYKSKPKKKNGKGGKAGKAFVLQHCWVLLQHDEKWRTRNFDVPTKSKKSSNSPIDDECVNLDNSDGSNSDGKRSPTPSSAPPKRPPGRKVEKEKLKKGGESPYKESLDNMMQTRKELAADRKEFKTTRWQEIKEMKERRAAAKERRALVEERRVAAEEATKRLEQEQRIMFMDPTNLDAKGRAYLEIMRDQVLVAKTIGGFSMGGFIGGFGGFGGNWGSFDIGGSGGFGGNGSSLNGANGGGNGGNGSSSGGGDIEGNGGCFDGRGSPTNNGGEENN
ncbi:unnamed protein product [Urochloa humidicola]